MIVQRRRRNAPDCHKLHHPVHRLVHYCGYYAVLAAAGQVFLSSPLRAGQAYTGYGMVNITMFDKSTKKKINVPCRFIFSRDWGTLKRSENIYPAKCYWYFLDSSSACRPGVCFSFWPLHFFFFCLFRFFFFFFFGAFGVFFFLYLQHGTTAVTGSTNLRQYLRSPVTTNVTPQDVFVFSDAVRISCNESPCRCAFFGEILRRFFSRALKPLGYRLRPGHPSGRDLLA